MKLLLFFITLFFMMTTLAATNDIYPFTNNVDASRFSTLTHELRCVVCQNQTIADSNAPIADDMRQKIYRMILDKKSDTEIKNYLIARYGEFILFKPRMSPLTLVLWSFPFLGLLLIFTVILKNRAPQ